MADIGSFPQNLTWIHAAVSNKPELMDGWMTDACATTADLLTKSSRVKNSSNILTRKNQETHGFQCIFNLPQLKYKEIHKVSWLSFYATLDYVYQYIYRTLDTSLNYWRDGRGGGWSCRPQDFKNPQ